MVSVSVEEGSEAVARIARPILGEDELDQVLDLVGPARIVLIGEASHGTHEFYDLRASLTRKLISERGFAGVAIEGDWPDALKVDRYVRGTSEDASAADALAGFRKFPTWMWRNEAVSTFVDWLRGHNAHRLTEERAGFYGIDLYSLHASVAAVLSFLADVDPPAAERARARYSCLDHARTDPQQYGLHAPLGLDHDCETEVLDQLVEMQRRRAARSGLSPNGEAWFHAMQNAHVVRDAEAYYRTMFADRTAAWNVRTTHMADTVDLLAQHLGSTAQPAKIVIWAHNSHVGDARATEMGDDGQITLGQLMRHRHPDEVALIGMTTHRGVVECANDWNEPGKREDVRPSLPGSWEELFHATGMPRFMVTSAALRRAVGESARRLHRAIGVVYRPESERRSHYYEARLADQYDVIIHIDETRAVRPLDRPMPPAAPTDPEPPETYPTGV